MKILNLNISKEEILAEVKKTYVISHFIRNCDNLKIEVIDDLQALKNLIIKFKKFDKMSVKQQVNFLIFKQEN